MQFVQPYQVCYWLRDKTHFVNVTASDVVWDRRSWDKTGLRPKQSVLVLVLHTVVLVLVLQVWCCVVKYGFVTLVVIMILKDSNFSSTFIVSQYCAWNITAVEINHGMHLLKSLICQLPLFTSGGLGLKNLVLFTLPVTAAAGATDDDDDDDDDVIDSCAWWQRPGGRRPDADPQVHGEWKPLQRAVPADHQADHRHEIRCAWLHLPTFELERWPLADTITAVYRGARQRTSKAQFILSIGGKPFTVIRFSSLGGSVDDTC